MFFHYEYMYIKTLESEEKRWMEEKEESCLRYASWARYFL